MSQLTKKKCVPCSGDEPTLEKDEIEEYMEKINSDWKYMEDPDKIVRDFKLNDFNDAITFVNEAAKIAEEEEHHPNLYIHDYNQVKVELWTHKINGLHENDFIMASKIDELSPGTRNFTAES